MIERSDFEELVKGILCADAVYESNPNGVDECRCPFCCTWIGASVYADLGDMIHEEECLYSIALKMKEKYKID